MSKKTELEKLMDEGHLIFISTVVEIGTSFTIANPVGDSGGFAIGVNTRDYSYLAFSNDPLVAFDLNMAIIQREIEARANAIIEKLESSKENIPQLYTDNLSVLLLEQFNWNFIERGMELRREAFYRY